MRLRRAACYMWDMRAHRRAPRSGRSAGLVSAWIALGIFAVAALAAGIGAVAESPGPKADRGAFTDHILRALAINRHRRPVYARLALHQRRPEAQPMTLLSPSSLEPSANSQTAPDPDAAGGARARQRASTTTV